MLATSNDGTWRYSSTVPGVLQTPGDSTTYFPSSLAEVTSAPTFAYRHNVLPDALSSRQSGGDTWSGTGDAQTYHLFETFVQSDRPWTIPLSISGDDGHSLFINGLYFGGAGFGTVITREIDLMPGVPVKIQLAGYNGPPSWGYAVGTPRVPLPANNPIFAFTLQDYEGVRINAAGLFPPVDGPSLLSNVAQPYGRSEQLGQGLTAAASFLTGPLAYTLDAVNIAAHTFSGGAAELRIHDDALGKPGALVASLGSEPASFSTTGVISYKSTGLALEPNKRYWISLGERASGDFAWRMTFDDGETAANAWSIGDESAVSADAGATWQTGERFAQPHEKFMLQIEASVSPGSLSADFNSSGAVNALDFGLWKGGFGRTSAASLADGDADADGDVDGVDLLTWQRQTGGTTVAAAIPEPGACWLAFVGTTGLVRGAQRSHRRRLLH